MLTLDQNIVVANVATTVGGVMSASAPASYQEMKADNITLKQGSLEILTLHSHILHVRKDATSDDLFLVVQKTYSEDPQRDE